MLSLVSVRYRYSIATRSETRATVSWQGWITPGPYLCLYQLGHNAPVHHLLPSHGQYTGQDPTTTITSHHVRPAWQQKDVICVSPAPAEHWSRHGTGLSDKSSIIAAKTVGVGRPNAQERHPAIIAESIPSPAPSEMQKRRCLFPKGSSNTPTPNLDCLLIVR